MFSPAGPGANKTTLIGIRSPDVEAAQVSPLASQ